MATPDSNDQEKTEGPATRRSVAHHLRENSLKAAGVAQIIADTSLLTYGALTGNMKIGSVGALGYTYGLIGMRYGNPKAEKQLEQVEKHLGAYLWKQGVTIPKDPTTASLTKEGGVIDHVESFLYQYPTQMMNGCLSLMGVQFARDGMQNKSKSLVASGALLITAALTGLLIKEKQPDPDHPPQGALQKAWSWVQEKPLRIGGTLMNLNQVGIAMDAMRERQQNPAQKNYICKLVGVAAFTFGNTMFALSSKSHEGEKMDAKTLGELAEVSARVIAVQPPEVQTAVLGDVAHFLSKEPHIHLSAPEISDLLQKKIGEAAVHPANAVWQSRTGTPGPDISPSL